MNINRERNNLFVQHFLKMKKDGVKGATCQRQQIQMTGINDWSGNSLHP